MKSTVGERGQVTIPKGLRDRLGIRPGEILEFEEIKGRLVARKVSHRLPTDTVYGVLKLGETTDQFMERVRGKARP